MKFSERSKARFRNLVQYRDMSDEEFDAFWENKSSDTDIIVDLEKRIEVKIDEFSQDYDLDDLKINDRLTLRALAQAYITLDDLEKQMYELRYEGVDLNDIVQVEKLNNVMSSLRRDISNMQTDLDITRKSRKSDKEASVISEIDRLKNAAREFYKEKMSYVWCPKCKMLLFTGWWLYPEEKRNKLRLVCNRTLEDGEICGETILINIDELVENGGYNIKDIPDSFKV